MKAKGILIALEGIDGSGTTTQAERVADWLQRKGHKVLVTAEPSDGYLGTTIRKVLRGELTLTPQALALLFAADRLDHLENVILPAMAEGTIVVTDRYLHSSYAYQAAAGKKDWLTAINKHAPNAGISVLLGVSSDVGAGRRNTRGEAEELFDATETQKKVINAYRDSFDNSHAGPSFTVDGGRSEEDVFIDIAHVLNRELNIPDVAKNEDNDE